MTQLPSLDIDWDFFLLGSLQNVDHIAKENETYPEI